MSANLTDKLTDTRNAARPNSARVTSGRSAGGATLACDNLSGWPTASKVHFVTYKIDSNSSVVAGSQLDCYGIVSGNNIGSFTVVDGTDTGHAVGDVVEMLPTAAWGQDLADALSVGHTRTGAHAANLPLTTPILIVPVIADHTSATHTHANAAGGGQLTGSTALVNSTVTADKLSTGAQHTKTAASETTTSTSYTDLATATDSAVATIGANGLALVSFGCDIANSASPNRSFIAVAMTGANTDAAGTNAVRTIQFVAIDNGFATQSGSYLATGLTAGSTTFKLKYKVNAGTGTFANRHISVIPL